MTLGLEKLVLYVMVDGAIVAVTLVPLPPGTPRTNVCPCRVNVAMSTLSSEGSVCIVGCRVRVSHMTELPAVAQLTLTALASVEGAEASPLGQGRRGTPGGAGATGVGVGVTGPGVGVVGTGVGVTGVGVDGVGVVGVAVGVGAVGTDGVGVVGVGVGVGVVGVGVVGVGVGVGAVGVGVVGVGVGVGTDG